MAIGPMQKVSSLVSSRLGDTLSNIKNWGGLFYNAADYGIIPGPDVTDKLQDLVNLANSEGRTTIVFLPGEYFVTSIINDENIVYFGDGASFIGGYGKTINSFQNYLSIESQLTGTVTMLNGESINVKFPPPPLLAAKGDGVTLDSNAINAVIQLSQSFGQYQSRPVLLPAGHYLLDKPLIVPHGTESKRATLFGYNATLRAATDNMDMIKVVAAGSPETYENMGQTTILGLRIEGAGVASRGLVIGNDGGEYPYGVDGTFKSIVRDVHIRDCKSSNVEISNSRLFSFDECTLNTSIDGACCIYINAVNDKQCCDHWFTNTQMAVTGTNSANVCVKIRVSSSQNTSGVGGLHFTDCVFYGQAVNCQANDNNAGFRDIFFTSCACDGLNIAHGYYGFYFSSVSNISGNIFFDTVWLNAQAFGYYLKNLDGCSINSGKISSTSYNAIIFEDCTDCSIVNVKLHDVNSTDNGGGAINLGYPGNRNKVIGNSIYNATGHSGVIILLGSGQVKPIVTNNSTDAGVCVTNNVSGTPGTDYVVTNNL